MPFLWYWGKTDTGPSPYQFSQPVDIFIGETAAWPTIVCVTLSSATSEIDRWFASRRPRTINCSLWSVCSAFMNAVEVTFSIASTSLSVSSRMQICLALVILTNRSPGPWDVCCLEGVVCTQNVRDGLWSGAWTEYMAIVEGMAREILLQLMVWAIVSHSAALGADTCRKSRDGRTFLDPILFSTVRGGALWETAWVSEG